jgi:hypothetical protein
LRVYPVYTGTGYVLPSGIHVPAWSLLLNPILSQLNPLDTLISFFLPSTSVPPSGPFWNNKQLLFRRFAPRLDTSALVLTVEFSCCELVQSIKINIATLASISGSVGLGSYKCHTLKYYYKKYRSYGNSRMLHKFLLLFIYGTPFYPTLILPQFLSP